MCGIYGIVARNIEPGFLETATNALSHRGPDDAGYYRDEYVGLGHRRLSIIDLSGGHQPILNEDRSRVIVFNGEIYNHGELRERLIRAGHQFTTRSDTETILHAYEEWGEQCVEELRGMFAFAIWDRQTKTLFIGRDRLGIKPLFFSQQDGKFSFASEMKAILADKKFVYKLDELALACYFNLSYIPSELTIFQGIRKLLPGHTLTLRDGEVRIKKYWDLHFEPKRGQSEQYFIDGFMGLLQEAVKIRLMSEVPLGAFLSGGIDSSTVVALMSRASVTCTNTFCMGFGGDVGGYLDERGFARQVADRYGTRHKEFEVHPEAEGLVETIVRSFDEPFADDSAIPSYFVCKIARENVTVALSGLGGDEVFAGYERYLGFVLSSRYGRLPTFLREGMIRPLVEKLPERADGHYTVNHMKRFVRAGSLPPGERYFGFLTKLNPALQETFFNDQGRFSEYFDGCRELILRHFNSKNVDGPSDSLNRALYCDLKTYLPEDILAVTDRLSMHHGLEVRVPFLDHKFLEFCSTIPPEMKLKGLQKKHLLKSAVLKHLPKDVITHRKQGFVGPMARWLKNDLKPFVLDILAEPNLRKHDLLNSSTVRRILDEHFSGREIHDTLIWSMMVFQSWFNLYLDKGGPGE
jgi:asparagine synthase (glutamine-hydrolysing)